MHPPAPALFFDNDSERLEWTEAPQERDGLLHWGQRKLLMAEIAFLSMYAPLQADEPVPWTVVYAGAAPGTHLGFLMSLFPTVARWIFFDMRSLAAIPDNDNVEKHEEPMTVARARELAAAHPSILFLSDVRTGDGKQQDEITADMEAQAQWHVALGARASMLKFRLPWTAGSTRYLKGRLMVPLWGPHNTTECRLVVEGHDMVDYDHQTHWERMCHFNRRVRGLHTFASEALDDCFDCRAERSVWERYIGLEGHHDFLSQLASRSLWSGTSQRTLAHRTKKELWVEGSGLGGKTGQSAQ